MADLDHLQAAEESSQRNHIWKICFETIIEGEDDADWAWDEYNVAAGEDSLQAVERLKEHVFNEEEYGVKILHFRLKDVKLIAVADI